MSKCEFIGCLLKKANLSEANLSNGNFIGCNFSQSNLSRANFSNSDLSSAGIADANMSDADLSNSILDFTDLVRTNLTRVNFNNAKMFKSNLTGSNLTNANFRNASLLYVDLSNTILIGTDFTDAEIEVEDTEIQKWLGTENLKKMKISSHMDNDYRKIDFTFISEKLSKFNTEIPVITIQERRLVNEKHTIIVKTRIKEYSVLYSVLIEKEDIEVQNISNLYNYSSTKESGLSRYKRLVVLRTFDEDARGNPLPKWQVAIYFNKLGNPTRIITHSFGDDISTEYF